MPLYLVLSALAGVYVGFGIALIFSVGGPLAASGSRMVKLVMGASFGIAGKRGSRDGCSIGLEHILSLALFS
ncbi:hypothetical protein [Petrachloros mirabilis]